MRYQIAIFLQYIYIFNLNYLFIKSCLVQFHCFQCFFVDFICIDSRHPALWGHVVAGVVSVMPCRGLPTKLSMPRCL